VLALLLSACTPPPLLDQPYRELPGVESELLSLDLYPLAEPAPLLVWVHGGAWQSGDKSKDIAAIVGVTPQYIHNVRSKIRKVLGVDNAVNWESFKDKRGQA